MTTPVGSGKNACYGYEDEIEPEILEPPPDGIMEEGSYFYCAVPPVNYTMATPGATGSTPCDLEPDYQTLTASISVGLTATVSATTDRYGREYTAGGGGLSTPGVSGAVLKGYLRDPADICEPPNPDKLEHFLTGGALNISAGFVNGAGITRSSGQIAVEVGPMTPQAGVIYTVGARHPNWE